MFAYSVYYLKLISLHFHDEALKGTDVTSMQVDIFAQLLLKDTLVA